MRSLALLSVTAALLLLSLVAVFLCRGNAPQEALAAAKRVLGEANDDVAGDEECYLCGGPQWLFVMGTGRSGSTSIICMLNSIPGFYISGENHGVMTTFRKIHNFMHGVRAPNTGSWGHEAWIDEKKEDCATQAMMRALIGDYSRDDTKVIGFKEIRHDVNDLNYFLEAFPCARFIINVRGDAAAQLESMQKNFNNSVNLSFLVDRTKNLTEWADKHTDRVFKLPLENFDVGHFNELLRWLGVKGCEYTSVAHANTNGYDQDEAAANMTGTCDVDIKMPWVAAWDKEHWRPGGKRSATKKQQ